MFRKIKYYLLIAAVFLFAAGCSLLERSPYRETASYDLVFNCPAEVKLKRNIRILPVINYTPTARRMLFSGRNGRISGDDYSQWVQNPESMLGNYLNKYFAAAVENMVKGGTAVPPEPDTLELEIYRFELDNVSGRAFLAVNYRITRNSEPVSGRLETAVPYEKKEIPEACAVAMSECAGQIAVEIVNIVNNIK